MADDQWLEKLQAGDAEGAWDLLIDQYHRLIFATVRHYADGYDDVMDLFTHVCESLRANDCARIHKFATIPRGRVRFSTWLVAVVRNLVIDWFRHHRGRKRLWKIVAELPPVQREAFQQVVVEGDSPAAAFEFMRTSRGDSFTYSQFVRALAEAQRTVAASRSGRLLREIGGRLPRASPHLPLGTATGPDPPDTELLQTEVRERLERALQELPVEERAAVQLYVVEGLPAPKVASLLGWKSPKTVYNHVYQSLSLLRQSLLKEGIERSDLF